MEHSVKVWRSRRLLSIVVILACASWVRPSTAGTGLHWKSSTADSPWADKPDIAPSPNDISPAERVITVDPAQRFQTIDGWGGCFNERGWRAMEVLSPEDRSRVMRAMFDPSDGLKLNICRTPIGASDYAVDLYTYDETPGDFQMSHFSIDRDRQRLLPYIKSALAIRPDLKVWGVPWSPPSWMKTNGKLTGGHIKTDSQTMDALALYFTRYVQAYRAEGIPLYMVMPQNEPCYATKYTSCLWTGVEVGLFVRDHLGPLFKRNHLDCEIYLGTFPRSDPKKFDYDYWIAPGVNDPLTRSYVTGVGCQWGGDPVMRDVSQKNPDLKLMQTETECGSKNTNDWPYAATRFKRIVQYLQAGAQSYMMWNLVLDQTGLSTAGWAQCSPIVVNQQTKAVTYTPFFYEFKHFSSFVLPGARRVAVSSSGADAAAFVNPNGQVVVVLEGTLAHETPIRLKVGDQTFALALPGNSFNTLVLDSAP